MQPEARARSHLTVSTTVSSNKHPFVIGHRYVSSPALGSGRLIWLERRCVRRVPNYRPISTPRSCLGHPSAMASVTAAALQRGNRGVGEKKKQRDFRAPIAMRPLASAAVSEKHMLCTAVCFHCLHVGGRELCHNRSAPAPRGTLARCLFSETGPPGPEPGQSRFEPQGPDTQPGRGNTNSKRHFSTTEKKVQNINSPAGMGYSSSCNLVPRPTARTPREIRPRNGNHWRSRVAVTTGAEPATAREMKGDSPRPPNMAGRPCQPAHGPRNDAIAARPDLLAQSVRHPRIDRPRGRCHCKAHPLTYHSTPADLHTGAVYSVLPSSIPEVGR